MDPYTGSRKQSSGSEHEAGPQCHLDPRNGMACTIFSRSYT